ncbi:MAG: hypothetical protein HPY76_02610 [Anaerolineae bacterium]|nr:hypothetical protein [Anaerolineae bacterium]
MFDDSELRGLLSMSPTHPVLSVYLNTDPSRGNADEYRLRLRNMLKNLTLDEDVDAVERFFRQQYDWCGRGVVVFSCAGEGWLRSYTLALPVRDLVQAGNSPVVKLLTNLLDNYGGYGVILVDKQGARAFSFHLGELVEQEGVMGKPVRHTKRGGASSVPGQRGGVAGRTDHMDEVVERNMKDAVAFALRFFEEKHIRRVLIGGTDENVAQFRALLPKAWQSLVVGDFPMSMTASHAEVLEKALAVGLAAEREHEAHLMQRLVTAAAKGEGAVTGLARTLAVVNDGRVALLVLREGLREPGQCCRECEALAPANGNTCPACGGLLAPVPDVIDLAVGRALAHGGEVQVMAPSDRLLALGEIGALLRY